VYTVLKEEPVQKPAAPTDVEVSGKFISRHTVRKSTVVGYRIYMEEQLQVAINRQRIGQPSPLFQSWVLNEWKKRKRISIQCIRITRLPAIKEESLDVYLYLKDYFQLIGKEQYANEVKEYIDELVEEKKIESVRFFEWQLYGIMKRKS